MADNNYYEDLVNPMKINSSAAMTEEVKRIERIEKGRMAEAVRTLTSSPLFAELQKQTQLNMITIAQQERQIKELQDQNQRLEAQLDLLKKSEDASSAQAKRSLVGFLISTIIAIASLVVAIIAIVI